MHRGKTKCKFEEGCHVYQFWSKLVLSVVSLFQVDRKRTVQNWFTISIAATPHGSVYCNCISESIPWNKQLELLMSLFSTTIQLKNMNKNNFRSRSTHWTCKSLRPWETGWTFSRRLWKIRKRPLLVDGCLGMCALKCGS